jgi:hypothetical protein
MGFLTPSSTFLTGFVGVFDKFSVFLTRLIKRFLLTRQPIATIFPNGRQEDQMHLITDFQNAIKIGP